MQIELFANPDLSLTLSWFAWLSSDINQRNEITVLIFIKHSIKVFGAAAVFFRLLCGFGRLINRGRGSFSPIILVSELCYIPKVISKTLSFIHTFANEPMYGKPKMSKV